MFLKQIELKGFKSFADRTVIDFSEGITCIVGPNGSGKSNITDAFRWVLGEQRYKTLRGTQMLDVIFNGTNQRKALGFAEVSITFDNQTGFLPIDFNEVKVTRRLHRSGESEYTINNVACRLKDIKQLFMDTGVGVEGYSIIGQGRIDSILSTNKDERRLIIEEAAGIVKYRTRKTEAERKLARVQQNLDRINDIVIELEERVVPLKAQAEKAKIYKSLAEELKSLEINLSVHDIEKANNNIKIISEDLQNKKSETDKKRSALALSQTALSELNANLETLEVDYEQHLTLQSEKQKYLVKLEGEHAVFNERKQSIKEKLSRMDQDSEAFDSMYKNLEQSYAQVKVLLSSKREDVSKVEAEILEADRAIHAHMEEADVRGSEKANLELKLNQIHVNVQEAIQANHRLSANDEISGTRLKAIQSDVDAFNTLCQQAKDDKDKASQKVTSLKAQLDVLNKDKALSHKQMQALQNEVADGENTLYNLRGQLAETSAKQSALLQQEENQEGFSHATKQILKWAKQDSNVYGALKDLFTIEQRFYTAIETALGRNLQTIVVKSDDVVDGYIERLKKERAGRATFIPIAQVEPRDIPKQDAQGGYYGCAMHYLTCEENLKPAFQYLLSNVFFAKTLKDAKIAARKLKKGSRIVTLEGEIVNAGGTLTGGSLSKRETGYLERKRAIKLLTQSVGETEAAIAKHVQERDSKKSEIMTLREHLAQLDKKVEDTKEEYQDAQRQYEKMLAVIADADRSRKQIDDEAISLNLAIEERAKQIQANNLLISKNKEDAEQLKALITTSNNKIKVLRERIEKENTDLTDKRIQFAAKSEALKSIEDKSNTIQEQIKNLEDRVKRQTEERTTLEAQSENVSISIKDNAKCREEEKKHVQHLEQTLEEQRIHIHHLKEEIHGVDSEIETLRQTLSNQSADVYKLEIELTRIETRKDAIIQNLWDNYELSYIKALDYKHDFDEREYTSKARSLKSQIKKLGDVNISAIAEYDTISERYEFLSEQREDLATSSEQLQKLIRDIDRQMRSSFKVKLEEINGYFKDTFSKLFGGGTGDITTSSDEDILNAEIIINAQPPGKKLQSLDLLSGGEKALTAISLLFAILRTKPSPFCILDEIEAALDDVNIFRFAEFLHDFVKNSQFIIITHRKGTMEIASSLYGVTMQEQGVTKMLSVKLEDAEQIATA